MRILILTPQLPYPPHQGTTLRNFNLIAGLARRHDIDLQCFARPGSDLEHIQPLRNVCRRIDVLTQPTRTLRQRLWTTLASPRPDMAHRLASTAFQTRLQETLQAHRYEVIELEGIEMAPYLPAILDHANRSPPRPLIVFDDHNAEYLLQKRVFEADIGRPRRWPGALYSWIQWHKLKRYEAWVCRTVDAVAAVSDQDATTLRELAPQMKNIAVVPNGVDIAAYTSFTLQTPILTPHSLLFTGTMDFRPNVDAVLWFVDQVLPRIRQQVADATLYVVGQRPHRRLAPLHGRPGVVITGRVPDTRPYLASAGVYVIPLRSGGGTRLKVLEAMAMKKPIVSTTMGCDGYPITSGQEALLVDDPAQFAEQVIQLLADPRRGQQLAEAGFAFARQYDWANIVPKLESLYAAACV